MQIVLSFKIVCNQESHHTNWLLPLSCHQCAQEVDRSMPLETNICPTVNTWTSSSHEFSVRKAVTQHVLITSLLPVKSIWSWGTRCMSYTMNFSPPVCISSFLLETVKWKNKANHKMRVRINENLTHFQVHMLMIHLQWSMQLVHVTCGCSCDSGWDTLLARNACS